MKRPVLIYQLARVGSKAIEASLNDARIPSLQLHYITCENDLPPRHENRRKKAKKLLNGGRRVKIITLARDPIERNISRFWIGYHHAIKLDGIMKLGMDHACEKFNEWLACGESMIPYFVPKSHKSKKVRELYAAHEPLRWFDKEFRPTLNLSIYNLKKPRGKHVIHIDKKVDILIMRTEDLNSVFAQASREFLGRSMKIIRRNSSGDWTKKPSLYGEFKSSVKVPEKILGKYYSSRYARHFYSPREIEEFYKRWAK